MNRASALFEKLGDADVDWIFTHAIERQVVKDEPLITAGQPVRAISIVTRGVLAVIGAAGEKLAVVGPGGVVGEMSLLEDRAPTESVVGQETTTVLVLPHEALEEKFQRDPHFAARLYRGMAKTLSQRLRRTNSQLAVQERGKGEGGAEESGTWRRVAGALDELEGTIHAVNEAARQNRDAVPDAAYNDLRAGFLRLYPFLNDLLGEASGEAEEVREQVGLHVQKELLPYILLTRNAERMYAKPRGYPGDFMTLDLIYQNVPRGSSRIGPALDRCILESPFCAAIRSRRTLFAAELARTAEETEGGTARITALACGPSGEMFDLLQQVGDASRVKATLADFDPQALALVADRRDRSGWQAAVELVSEDMVSLSAGRTRLETHDQDLVYSLAIADHANDAAMVKLLDAIHGMLRPGGRVVLGSFHPANPCRAFMDHVLEWRMAHRSQEEVSRLFQQSAFGRPTTAVRFEPTRTVFAAECVRE